MIDGLNKKPSIWLGFELQRLKSAILINSVYRPAMLPNNEGSIILMLNAWSPYNK